MVPRILKALSLSLLTVENTQISPTRSAFRIESQAWPPNKRCKRRAPRPRLRPAPRWITDNSTFESRGSAGSWGTTCTARAQVRPQGVSMTCASKKRTRARNSGSTGREKGVRDPKQRRKRRSRHEKERPASRRSCGRSLVRETCERVLREKGVTRFILPADSNPTI